MTYTYLHCVLDGVVRCTAVFVEQETMNFSLCVGVVS